MNLEGSQPLDGGRARLDPRWPNAPAVYRAGRVSSKWPNQVCQPSGLGWIVTRLVPGASLRSATGYRLASLRDEIRGRALR
jgi:hypothetical protein